MPKLVQNALKVDHTPLGLVAVILHQLYYEQPREQFFIHKRQGFHTFLEDCVSSAPPDATMLQRNLCSLLGEATEAHLYIPRWDAETPTHYISIIKDPATGTWKPRHSKIRAVGSRLSYGVLVSWKAVTPVPEVAIDIVPKFNTLLRGKTAFDSLAATLIEGSNYIVQDEAAQCILLARMFGQAGKNRLTLWVPGTRRRVAGARVSLVFDEDNRLSDPRIRKSTPYPDRFHIRTTDAPIEPLCPASMSLVPVLPGYEPEEFFGAEEMLLEQILKNRVLPYVGHQREDGKIDVYSLAMNPSDGSCYPVKIFKNRLPRNCASIPYFRSWPKYPNVWIPNDVLAKALRDRLIDTESKWFLQATLSTMPYFGAVTIENYNAKVFARYGMELSKEQVERILISDSSEVSLQETQTGISTSGGTLTDGVS